MNSLPFLSVLLRWKFMYLAISTAFDMMAPEPAQIPHFLLIKKKILKVFSFFYAKQLSAHVQSVQAFTEF